MGARGGFAQRPNAQLFVVPRLAEKETCKEKPVVIDDDALIDDKVVDWVEKLLDHDDIDMVSKLSSWQNATKSLESFVNVVARAEAWGAVDPTAPIEGFKPPCQLSGPGAVIKLGFASASAERQHTLPSQSPAAAAVSAAPIKSGQRSSDLISENFQWTEVDVDLLAEDTCGVPLEQGRLTASASSGYSCSIHQNPPFLYWAARHKYMWHRKWAIPTITVEVHRSPVTPAPAGPLFVMLSSGTLRDDEPGMHDTGLTGQCQAELELDSYGHGTVRFTRILFKHTSFNCGSRPFHLVVTILAAPPVTAGGGASNLLDVTSSFALGMGAGMGAPHSYCEGAPSFVDGVRSMDYPLADEASSAIKWRKYLTAGGAPPSIEGGANTPPRIPIMSLISTPIHVDARKRSKGERSDAAPDDVRLLQRADAGSSTMRAQAGHGHVQADQTPQQWASSMPNQWAVQRMGGTAAAQQWATQQKEVIERQAAAAQQWMEQQQAATTQQWARQQWAAQQWAAHQDVLQKSVSAQQSAAQAALLEVASASSLSFSPGLW